MSGSVTPLTAWVVVNAGRTIGVPGYPGTVGVNAPNCAPPGTIIQLAAADAAQMIAEKFATSCPAPTPPAGQ